MAPLRPTGTLSESKVTTVCLSIISPVPPKLEQPCDETRTCEPITPRLGSLALLRYVLLMAHGTPHRDSLASPIQAILSVILKGKLGMEAHIVETTRSVFGPVHPPLEEDYGLLR